MSERFLFTSVARCCGLCARRAVAPVFVIYAIAAAAFMLMSASLAWELYRRGREGVAPATRRC
jgi:hypothetical protein